MNTFRARITDGWLPFPDGTLAAVGWTEGDEVVVEVVGDCLVLTKLADTDGYSAVLRTPPSKRRSLVVNPPPFPS